MAQPSPIFFDDRQRRWRRTRRLLEIGGGILLILLTTFFVGMLRQPELPTLLLPEVKPALHAVREKRRRPKLPPRSGRKKRIASLGRIPEGYDPLRAAFYVPWDSTSLASLKLHYRDLDVLMPEMLHAITPDGAVNIEVDGKLTDWYRTSGAELPMMPLVNNFDGKDWRSRELAEMLAHPEARQRLHRELLAFARQGNYAGLVVDFEEIPAASQPHFRELIRDLGEAFRKENLKLMVALPSADNNFDYRFFAQQCDAVILMNYDQHWPTSGPGPIAAQSWFVKHMDQALQWIPPEKLVMAIANYSYDWTVIRGAPPALSTSVQQAMVTAVESEATIEFDADSLNPHFSYSDEKERVHQVWFLDALTAYNQMRAAERAGARGTALWRLGSEDASLWSIWDATHPDDATRQKLTEVQSGYDLVLEGQGDIWRISATPKPGKRTFAFDAASGLFTDEVYSALPIFYQIDQSGGGTRQIVLTFDDGPDARFTPRILDILKEKGVHAGFFVTGLRANEEPQILRRIFDEGHELGNHTYTHPRLDQISHAQLRLELNLTERLLESRLGMRTIFFRPPYGVDHQPEAAQDVDLLPIPQGMGYLIVGSQIDPHDWGNPEGGPPPSAEAIAERVLEQARAGKGNIVLLHDGGGNREATVAALPLIIDRLRAAGFTLTTITDLLGKQRAETMPAISPDDRWTARLNAFAFDLYHWLRLSIAGIFLAGIALVSLRAVFVGALALLEKMRRAPAFDPAYRPTVSVVIPAYNEEEAIVQTVRSVLESDYTALQVIVVDDGSHDRTVALVREHFGNDSRVRLLEQTNSGKPAALNHALAGVETEIIISIDADTFVAPEAIGRLVRHFSRHNVGAVAGNAKVANRDRWLTRWQALEYITSQNLEKRAFDLLNCITVVPGAIGAWRTQAIRACGGFSPDTVAEDTDLTLAIRRRGWRILYEEEAIAFTHAPETAKQLIRQRFRWTFGTLQAVWKHRDTLGHSRYGTLGWIGLPNIFLFQIVLPLVSPVLDLLFVGSLALWALAQWKVTQIPPLWTTEDVQRALIFFLAFTLIDVAACAVAFLLEPDEDWTLLEPLLLQRFYYRQMMYVVLFRSLMRAVQGRAIGWEGGEPPSRTASGPA